MQGNNKVKISLQISYRKQGGILQGSQS
jgi:hypothetical protein